VKQSETIAKEESVPMQHKDYSLKEGQKITVNIGVSYIGWWVEDCMVIFGGLCLALL